MGMIRGMTGFGCAAVTYGEIQGMLEIKSVNHRYLDTSFYLPIGFASIENKIRDIVQEYLERGRVTISFKIISGPLQIFDFNKEAVRKYLKYAQVLKKEFGLNDHLTLSDLTRLPGVLESKEMMLNAEELWPVLEGELRKALLQLDSMRHREGRSLARDVTKRLHEMGSQIKIIQRRCAIILKEKKKILNPEEFSSFQKNSDVHEELSRLIHYIDEFKPLFKSENAIGKKMDFIAQEMQRETNTIGSKLQDKVVANSVIALKSKIEKIREQSQNIE